MKEIFLIDTFISDIMNIIEFLSGKKTYIVGILMIALGILQNNNQMILEGFGLMTLRAGISK